MTLATLEKSYKAMDEQAILTALMRITGPELSSIMVRSGNGDKIKFTEKIKLYLWTWTPQGRRVCKFFLKAFPDGKRVGISQNIEQRKAHWRSVYPKMTDWQIIKTALSYDQAQALENEYLSRGYDGSPGGPRMPGYNYSVYTFSF